MTITTYTEAVNALKSLDEGRSITRAKMFKNRAYLDGDHWQGGEGWGGPPLPDDLAARDATLIQLESDHAPVPVLAEVINRYATGLVGRRPHIEVVLGRELEEGEKPSGQEEGDLRELNEALTSFYDKRNAQSKLHDFVCNLCSGRGVLRFFIPPDAPLDGESTLEGVMENFFLEVPDWESCGVVVDWRKMRPVGIFLYREQATIDGAPVPIDRAEITELLDDKRTLFRVIEGGGAMGAKVSEAPSDEDDAPKIYDCDGHVWVFQARTTRPLIGDPQRKLQRVIDFLNTILPKNAQYAGYRERHFLNVKHPTDENGNLLDPQMGPTTVNFWQGSTYEDSDGKVHHAPATLLLGEPVDSSPIRADIEHNARLLLRSCYQEHVVISGDATASAISRVQARAEFADSLLAAKPKVEQTLRELFTTVLCLACEFTGNGALLERLKTQYRIRVDLKPNAGPLTPDERRVIIEQMNAGYLSKSTGLALLGTEDVPAELNEMQSDPDSELATETRRAALLREYSAIFDIETAATLAGYDEDQIALMTQGADANDEDVNRAETA